MFLPGGRIVGNVFDNHLDRLDLGACPVVEEEGGQETDQRQPGEHRHGVRRQGVGAGQNGVHSKKKFQSLRLIAFKPLSPPLKLLSEKFDYKSVVTREAKTSSFVHVKRV